MKTIIFHVFILLFFVSSNVLAIDVNVGGYLYPPMVEINKGEGPSGLTHDLIAAFNDFQKVYHFKFIMTSPNRRYEYFEKGKFNLIFFEDKKWGWQTYAIDASNVFLKGGEYFITKADSGKDQSYFDDLKGKSIACFLGYHYAFADFNSDSNYLKSKFNAQLSTTHEGNIRKVIKGRADFAIITYTFLQRFLKNNPEMRPQILIRKEPDQYYNHTILVRKNAKPSVKEINTLLSDMEKAGVLSALWKKYGIEPIK